MPSEPFVVNLGASNHSPVRGCPGVPKTCPRVDSVLEIRSKNGSSFAINTIILELNTIQSVSVPANGGFSSTDASRKYCIYKNTIYKSSDDNKPERILGMDLPFVIPLNKDVVSSGRNSRWNAKTVHNLTVRIGWSGSKLEVFSISFPLIIKRYDTLPLYRQFNEPITKTIDSPDRNILVEYSLPNTSVGPKDELLIFMKIFPNQIFLNNLEKLNSSTTGKRLSFMKRKPPVFKLKKIYFELREVLICHEGGLGSKQTKLLSKQQDFDAELGTDGITTQISFDFPSDVKNIISNSLSNALNATSQLKKLPLGSLNSNNSHNLSSGINATIDKKSNNNSANNNRHSIDGYSRPQLTKRLTGGLLSNNKRRSLDLKNSGSINSLSSGTLVEDDLNSSNVGAGTGADVHTNANAANSSFDDSSNDSVQMMEVKPMPSVQSMGLNNNHKTLTTNTKLLEEVNTGVPLTHMQGFTTNGKLFSIKYELVFKIKVNNCPAIKFSQPVTVSPYDRIQSSKILKWIIKEWDMAQFINNTTFQTNFNNEKVNYINSFTASTSSDDSGDEFGNNNTPRQLYKRSQTVDDANFRASINLSASYNCNQKNNINQFLTRSMNGNNHNNNYTYGGSKNANNNNNNNNGYFDYTIGAFRRSATGTELGGGPNYYNPSGSLNGYGNTGGNDVDQYGLTIYQSKPFHIYRPQNQMDWKLLGLSEKAIGAYGKSLIHYID